MKPVIEEKRYVDGTPFWQVVCREGDCAPGVVLNSGHQWTDRAMAEQYAWGHDRTKHWTKTASCWDCGGEFDPDENVVCPFCRCPSFDVDCVTCADAESDPMSREVGIWPEQPEHDCYRTEVVA